MLSLISCRSDTFRRREPRSTNNQIMPQLLDAACTQENHQKTKEIPRVPRHNFLYSCSSCLQSCEFKALMAGVCALIDKDPLPHSGAQSVSRWLLWNSTCVVWSSPIQFRYSVATLLRAYLMTPRRSITGGVAQSSFLRSTSIHTIFCRFFHSDDIIFVLGHVFGNR